VGNPTVGVRAMVGAPDLPAATYALLVGVPFDVSGVRGRWRSESTWAEREAEARAAVAVNEARSRARLAVAEAAVARALVQVAVEREATAAHALAQTQTRAEARSSTALDLTLAEREAAEAAADVAAARRAQAEADGRLRDVLDLDPTAPIAVAAAEVPAAPEGLTLPLAVARARAQRREAAAFRAAGVRLRRASERLRAGAIAPLFVAAELEWQGYSQASVGASAQWSLPLAQTAQGDRAVAAAEAASADVAAGLAGRAAEREAATAWASLEHARDELAALDGRVLPNAERALVLTESLFREGAADAWRLLLARQAVATARVRRLGALRESWRARIDLDRATGTP
jgi:cobalt-zinc-cadmium efflux system outer membrane protein